MKKVSYWIGMNYMKKNQTEIETEEVQLKSTNALFPRLLVIGLSDIDLQNTISDCEFNAINPVLMKPDGTLLSCADKVNLSMRCRSL